MRVLSQLKPRSNREELARVHLNKEKGALISAAPLDLCRENEEVLKTDVALWYLYLKVLTKKLMLQEQLQVITKVRFREEEEVRKC